MKKRVYISGAISGHHIEERRATFKQAQVMLETYCDYDVFNPLENGLPLSATTAEHMKRDLEELLKCDIVFFLKGWTHSAGCKCEFEVATAIGLEIWFEDCFMNKITFK